ncbi:MAG: PH domain-containing protein [Candidatus Edwardsbacteria bacterium]
MEKKKIFKPQFSLTGWISSIIILLISSLIVFAILKAIPFIPKGIPLHEHILFGVTFIMACCFLLASLGFLLIYPTMRYEVENGYLILRCGPFRSKISIKDCEIIGTHTLKYHPTSTGWKIPGYALFRVYYADAGYVKMYSTAMLRNILLIQTEKEIYGITPADEEGFIKEIERQKGAKIY